VDSGFHSEWEKTYNNGAERAEKDISWKF
jgi:hypothetical protein